MNYDVKELGTFEVTSGQVMVSDPCYEVGTWCQGILDNAKNGRWKAEVEIIDDDSWGKRVSALTVQHANCKRSDFQQRLEEAQFEVGVDSGQAGIYDVGVYQEDKTVPANALMPNWIDKDDKCWYGMCCGLTLSEDQAGIIPGGAVSSSGFGDGGYTCVFGRDEQGQITYIKVTFISDEDLEEEEGNNDDDM